MRVATLILSAVLTTWTVAGARAQETPATTETEGASKLEPVARTAREIAWTALAESDDPAFEQFVSEDNLRAAFYWRDAGQLADCALQLAHGERILLREHKSGITPKMALEFAAESKEARHDKEGLDRLATAAESVGLQDLAAKFETAAKTAAPSRAGGVKSCRRVQYGIANPKVYQVLRSHKAFQGLFSFGPGGRVMPRKGVTIYYNAAAKTTVAVVFPVPNPPQYITFAESTRPIISSDGGWSYTWCSCDGFQIPPSTSYDPTAANPTGDHCHFEQDGPAYTCVGFCDGDCKFGFAQAHGDGRVTIER